jgi:hypothetical protein
MPLFRVTFREVGGYRIAVRVRAATRADHVRLAVEKIWGEDACWLADPLSHKGRVCRVGYASPVSVEAAVPLVPCTGLMTVTVEPVGRTPQELPG